MSIKMEYLILCVGLFVVLSPGLFLTIPPLQNRDAIALGVSWDDSGSATLCANTNFSGGSKKDSCAAATRLWRSEFTTFTAVVIHAIVYAILLQICARYLGLPKVRTDEMVYLAALFVILTPGLFLTLPRLTKEICGKNGASDNGRHIADDGNFCEDIGTINSTTPNCQKCTSVFFSQSTQPISVLVHAVLLGVILQFGKLV